MLTLKRTYENPAVGPWSYDNYNVLDGDQSVGRVLLAERTPGDQRWFWTAAPLTQSALDHGYAASREQAMADFTARWDALHSRQIPQIPAQSIAPRRPRTSGAISPHNQIVVPTDTKTAA